MYSLLVKILKTLIFIIFWSDGINSKNLLRPHSPRDLKTTNSTGWLNLFLRHYVNKREINENYKTRPSLPENFSFNSLTNRLDDSRSYYGVPAPPYIPAFDPISVLATLAFFAFLLQSFSALFDRTRSIIPTIISGRRLDPEYNDYVSETEKRVLRALEEYASLNNNFLKNEKENKKPTS